MYFGAHVSSSGGVHKAVERAASIGADALQIFTQSPRMWKPQSHKPENIEQFIALRQELGIKAAVAHAIYLINIASPDKDLWTKSAECLVNHMGIAHELMLDAVVLHPGSLKETGFEECLPKIVEALHRALDGSSDTWLLLENSAGQGGTVGRSVEELAAIIDAAGSPNRLGICIDTCHWFVSGVDVTDPDILDVEMKKIDQQIGCDRLRVLHINDALTPIASNRDRHANIMDGHLGSGLATFLNHPMLQGLPAILEVPGYGDGPTREELDKVRALHG